MKRRPSGLYLAALNTAIVLSALINSLGYVALNALARLLYRRR